ncbi:MFS transporter [Streptomyces olivochromogenes]|uniref:MFS transporter n=1 Tax=Streptomyces olivochromogenes TaxID=1963 RepID=A0A250VV47_STROL|nr:MFS transporter [Streptomyces olivochromogenes]
MHIDGQQTNLHIVEQISARSAVAVPALTLQTHRPLKLPLRPEELPMPFFAHTPAEKMTEPYPRRWWALLVLCLSLLIVAAPDMTRDLGLSRSWASAPPS